MTTALTRWNPVRELEDFQRRILSAFNGVPASRNNTQDAVAQSEWMPPVDIVEDDKEYLITAELPEVIKEDVKVTLENRVLTISGERKFEKDEETKRYHRIERAYGSFLRTFTLPEDADMGKVSADFKEGLLRVRVSKSEQAKRRQIDVKIN